MEFKTTFTEKEIDFIYFAKQDHEDIVEKQAIIDWEVSFETRTWGIKSVYINIKKVWIYYELVDEDGNITRKAEINGEGFEIDFIDLKFLTQSEALVPSLIEVDFNEKTIKIS